MNNKYIIRNCPAINQNFEDEFVCTSQIKVKSFPFYCQNCTDCLLKQIVEKCKDIKKDHYWGMREIRFSQEILELLDIQECEND